MKLISRVMNAHFNKCTRVSKQRDKVLLESVRTKNNPNSSVLIAQFNECTRV